MVDQVLDVCEGVEGEGISPDDIVILARAVHALAPERGDVATRAGLIHIALRRARVAPQNSLSDCLSEAVEHAKAQHTLCDCGVSADFARVLSLAFAACAGDLADPAKGADIAFPHNIKEPHNQGLRPIALLGGFLFFKTSHPI